MVGGAASSPFGFGAGGLFGGAPAASAAGGGLYGAAPAPVPRPAGGGLFGGPTTSAPTIFGAAPAGAPAAASTGLFGAPAAASMGVGGGGLFGGVAPITTTTTSLPSSSFPPQQLDETAVHELVAIDRATLIEPSNRDYKLRHLFLNLVGDRHARTKPPHVDERMWNEALRLAGGPDNADHLWPVPAMGFHDLRQRAEVQKREEKANIARLRELEARVAWSAQRRATGVQQRLESAQRRHGEQLYRLVRVFRHLDGLEAALSGPVHGPRDASERPRGGESAADRSADHRVEDTPGSRRHHQPSIRETLTHLEHALGPTSADNLLGRASSAAALARARMRSRGREVEARREAERHVDPDALDGAFRVLQQQLDAIQRLQDVVGRGERDLKVVMRDFEQ